MRTQQHVTATSMCQRIQTKVKTNAQEVEAGQDLGMHAKMRAEEEERLQTHIPKAEEKVANTVIRAGRKSWEEQIRILVAEMEIAAEALMEAACT